MKKQFSFEEVFKQNERRVQYHLRQLRMQAPYQEIYHEGLRVMMMAYETYTPNAGPFATYFNVMIRNRLIELLWEKNQDL
ncbi:sigma factor [Virgibacillus sp. CBA3643]|uniref:sigma factor n=1 Tax=Virgibacillus sp. CBA3643 TaxID=2942278 RepID=UPI0035A28273